MFLTRETEAREGKEADGQLKKTRRRRNRKKSTKKRRRKNNKKKKSYATEFQERLPS